MAEQDLVRQLDAAVDAMLRGTPAEPHPSAELVELTELVAALRGLPDERFRDRLKSELIDIATKEYERMTATSPQWIPAGFHTLTPYLHAPRSAKLMDFLIEVFGAEEKGRHLRPDGSIMHGELRIGDSMLEMGEDPPEQYRRITSLHAYVQDVDATYQRALAAGATSLYAPVDQSYGDRDAGIQDTGGNVWYIGRRIGDPYKWQGHQDVSLFLHPHGTPAYLEFLQKAFAAQIASRHDGPDGTVAYATVRIGDSMMGMSEAHGRWQPMPGALHMYVPDIDAAYRRALEAGATSMNEPKDQPYGERSATVVDPMGNLWHLATLTEPR